MRRQSLRGSMLAKIDGDGRPGAGEGKLNLKASAIDLTPGRPLVLDENDVVWIVREGEVHLDIRLSRASGVVRHHAIMAARMGHLVLGGRHESYGVVAAPMVTATEKASLLGLDGAIFWQTFGRREDGRPIVGIERWIGSLAAGIARFAGPPDRARRAMGRGAVRAGEPGRLGWWRVDKGEVRYFGGGAPLAAGTVLALADRTWVTLGETTELTEVSARDVDLAAAVPLTLHLALEMVGREATRANNGPSKGNGHPFRR